MKKDKVKKYNLTDLPKLEIRHLIWLAQKATPAQASYEIRAEARRLLEARGYRFIGERIESVGPKKKEEAQTPDTSALKPQEFNRKGNYISGSGQHYRNGHTLCNCGCGKVVKKNGLAWGCYKAKYGVPPYQSSGSVSPKNPEVKTPSPREGTNGNQRPSKPTPADLAAAARRVLKEHDYIPLKGTGPLAKTPDLPSGISLTLTITNLSVDDLEVIGAALRDIQADIKTVRVA
jgi:hypothetical protein